MIRDLLVESIIDLGGSLFFRRLFPRSFFCSAATMASNLLRSLVCCLLFGRLPADMEGFGGDTRCRGSLVLPV